MIVHIIVWQGFNRHIATMCGRVIQSSAPIRYAIVDGMNVGDSCLHNYPPRWNGAPSQDLLVIRRNSQTGEVSLDPLQWGLIPYRCKDPKGGRKPINVKAETVARLPSFRDAYRRRRCIVPVGFFEWKAIKSQKAKQPYAIAMKDGSPFGLGGLWENWKDPASGEWIRTFAITTTDANELVAEIHDRMPLILGPATTPAGSATSLIRASSCDLSRRNRCACGRFQPGSTSRRITIRPSWSRLNYLPLRSTFVPIAVAGRDRQDVKGR